MLPPSWYYGVTSSRIVRRLRTRLTYNFWQEMKRSLTFLFAVTLVCCGRCEDRVKIPEGVVYRFMDDGQLAEVRTLLVGDFARGQGGVGELFKDECTCAPGYWRLVRSGMVAPHMESFAIPNRLSGKTYNLVGAQLKDPRDLKTLSASVSGDLGETPTIRRLSTKEIAQFWVVVPFDIVEPVFVVEGLSRKLVLCLKKTNRSGWRIWWVDALTEYDWGRGRKNAERPNQLPEATPTAVTPAAIAPAAPLALAAHR